MRDADELLTQWGRWVWQGTGIPGYGISPLHAIMRDRIEQSGDERSMPADITDEDAMMVDSAVAMLWKNNPMTADCLRVYYCTEMSLDGVGRMFDLQKLKVREMLIAGKNYVQACLDMRMAA